MIPHVTAQRSKFLPKLRLWKLAPPAETNTPPGWSNQLVIQNSLDKFGYGSIPINTLFRGMNIHKSQLFWCSPGVQGWEMFLFFFKQINGCGIVLMDFPSKFAAELMELIQRKTLIPWWFHGIRGLLPGGYLPWSPKWVDLISRGGKELVNDPSSCLHLRVALVPWFLLSSHTWIMYDKALNCGDFCHGK